MKTWGDVLGEEKQRDYFVSLLQWVKQCREAGKKVYPPANEVFNAFKLTEFDAVKVVILGQDPYHGFGQAQGLCFSVAQGVPHPPSLVNIFKELSAEYKNSEKIFSIPKSGSLIPWAKQGVFLLNTVLTVEGGHPQSHAGKGWEQFTDKVIELLNKEKDGLIFLLWGAPAQKKAELIDSSRHTILKAPHPSPLSAHRGFFGCDHFKKVNEILKQKNLPEIDWRLD